MKHGMMMWFALVASLTMGSAMADEGFAFGRDIHADQAVFTTIEQMHSNVGENEVDFLKRVGVKLLAYSEQTNFEACGLVARRAVVNAQGDGHMEYAITITTNQSHLMCVERVLVPDGFEATTKTIHSHGYRSSFQVNAADVALTGGKYRLNRWESGRDQNAFSPQDKLAPGYLASRVGLLYQDGKGEHSTVTNYGRYDEPTVFAQR